MNHPNKKRNKSLLVIGAMTLMGIGVGLVFFEKSPLLIVVSILVGIGLGLIIRFIVLSKKKRQDRGSERFGSCKIAEYMGMNIVQ